MNYNAVFDVSSIVWDEKDFEANSKQYYNILSNVAILFGKLNLKKTLIRYELSNELMSKFPFEEIQNLKKYGNDFWDIGSLVIRFLGKMSIESTTYPANCIAKTNSNPNIIKSHFSDTLKKEVCYLISKIHSDDEAESKYFTFNYLWNGNDNLKTKTEDKTNTYETIIADKDNDLDDFFAKFKPKFEHNPKHDKKSDNTKEKWLVFHNKDAFDSRLSCYNGNDNIIPQKILDDKYPHQIGDGFIGYDDVNEVYVRFKPHKDNLYHGFDEYDIDNIEKIPLKVRKHFNK